jgi:AraC-like DNA-binding protein
MICSPRDRPPGRRWPCGGSATGLPRRRAMKRGLYLAPFDELADRRLLAELARVAESRGWDGLFLWDRMADPPSDRAVGGLSAIAGPGSASARPGPCTRPRSADALTRREYHPARQAPASSSFLLAADTDGRGRSGDDGRLRGLQLDPGSGRMVPRTRVGRSALRAAAPPGEDAEVCFAVGCSSLGTFSTRFTDLIGMPPSTYRRHAARATRGCRRAWPSR